MPCLMQTWGLTTRALADNIGCSKSLVHNLSSGTRDSTSEYVAVRLSKELQVPTSTLFDVPRPFVISGQDERLVTTAWVASRLNRPEEWVREAATAGHIPAARIGRQFRFRPSDIQTYIDLHYRASA